VFLRLIHAAGDLGEVEGGAWVAGVDVPGGEECVLCGGEVVQRGVGCGEVGEGVDVWVEGGGAGEEGEGLAREFLLEEGCAEDVVGAGGVGEKGEEGLCGELGVGEGACCEEHFGVLFEESAAAWGLRGFLGGGAFVGVGGGEVLAEAFAAEAEGGPVGESRRGDGEGGFEEGRGVGGRG
jgi:hypothetical protein